MAIKKESAPKSPGKHLCELSLDRGLDAEVSCEEDEKSRFFLRQGDIGYQINYCPMCGEKAPAQIEEEFVHTRKSFIEGVGIMDDLISDYIEHQWEDEKVLESMSTSQLKASYEDKVAKFGGHIDDEH